MSSLALLLIISFIFSPWQIFAYNKATTGPIYVKDFKSFREYQLPNKTKLFFQKKEVGNRVTYIKENSTLTSQTKGSLTKFDFWQKDKHGSNFLAVKLSPKFKKVGFYTKKNQKYYFSAPQPSCSVFSNPLNQEFKNHISEKFTGMKINKMIDQASCNKIDISRSETLVDTISTYLNPSAAPLLACLESKSILSVLAKDELMNTTANQVFANYLNFVGKIASGEQFIKIKCGDDSAVSASIDQTISPQCLTINSKFITVQEKSIITPFINHEFTHMASEQVPTKSNILDEKIVSRMDCFCKRSNLTPEEIVKLCPVDTSVSLLEKPANMDTEVSLTTEVAIQVTNEMNKMAFQSDIKGNKNATFTPAPSSTIESLANNSLLDKNGTKIPTDGSSHEVFLAPDMLEKLEAVSNTFANQASATTKAISAALIEPTPAYAKANDNFDTESAAPTNFRNAVPTPYLASTSKSTTSAASSVPQKFEPYTMNEIVKDKYSTKFEAPDANSIALADKLYPQDVIKTNSTATVAVADTKQVKGSIDNSTGASSFRAAMTKGNLPSTPGVTTKAVPASNDAVVPEPTVATTAPNRAPASIETAKANIIQTPVDSSALQTLSVVSKVSGKEYVQIRSRYNDPNFIKELESRGISIEVQTMTNKKIVLNAKSAMIKFIDNGRGLVKVQK